MYGLTGNDKCFLLYLPQGLIIVEKDIIYVYLFKLCCVWVFLFIYMISIMCIIISVCHLLQQMSSVSEGHRNYFKDCCLMNSQPTFLFLTNLNLMNYDHIYQKHVNQRQFWIAQLSKAY